LKISYILNTYSIIGAAIIAIYLFSPINDRIKKIRYKKAVNVLVLIIFCTLTMYGVYENITSISHKGVFITPHEYTAHPLYQEFTAHVTNNFDYPVYNYKITIFVKDGDLDVNTDLKIIPIQKEDKTNSNIPVSMFGLGGKSKKYGLSYVFYFFPEIEANSTKKFLVRVSGEKYKKESIIEFVVGGYKTEPNPWFSVPMQLDKNGNLPNLNLPESMKNKK